MKILPLLSLLLVISAGLALGFELERDQSHQERNNNCNCQPAFPIEDPIYEAMSSPNSQAKVVFWNYTTYSQDQLEILPNSPGEYCGDTNVLLSSGNQGQVFTTFEYNGETFFNPATIVAQLDICRRSTLKFKYQFGTVDFCNNNPFNDIFMVFIDSSFGRETLIVKRITPNCNEPITDFSLDLQKYRGQIITLTFLAATQLDTVVAAFAHIDCLQLVDPCSNCPCNDACCISEQGSRCYSVQTHTCINGKLCGNGLQLCGQYCYDPKNYGCCTLYGIPRICPKFQATPPTFTPCPASEAGVNAVPCVSFSNPNFQTGQGFVYYDPRCTSTPSISGCRPDLSSSFCRNCQITAGGNSPNECPQCVKTIFGPYFPN